MLLRKVLCNIALGNLRWEIRVDFSLLGSIDLESTV